MIIVEQSHQLIQIPVNPLLLIETAGYARKNKKNELEN
jgi:hypothetical protein